MIPLVTSKERNLSRLWDSSVILIKISMLISFRVLAVVFHVQELLQLQIQLRI